MSSLVQWASSHAEGLLGPLGDRWAHVQAVAEQASRIATAVLPADERETLVAAVWLHDIGYAPALATTGLHTLDGARHLEALVSAGGSAQGSQDVSLLPWLNTGRGPRSLLLRYGGLGVGCGMLSRYHWRTSSSSSSFGMPTSMP
jgi:hypothetical protein